MLGYETMLGQHYHAVLQQYPDLQRVAVDDSITCSEQDYYLSDAQGTLQYSLDEQGCTSALFAYFDQGAPAVFSVHAQTSIASLIARFGQPIAKGRGRQSALFGHSSGWVKFAFQGLFIHLEFEASRPLIKMMTLMQKNIG